MARNLQPCGTWAAYKRHLRKGEEPCDDCREAARVQQRERSAARRAAREQSGTIVDTSAPVSGHPPPVALALDESLFDGLTLEPLTVAKQDLVVIEQFMTSPALLPSQFTSLSRRREELVDRIRALSADTDDGGDALDELARRREDRIAAAAD